MAPVPRDNWLSLDGLKLHYRDWGGSGQPVVLVHGLASTCRIWDLVAPLLGQDLAVFAVDQRGHGESDKPEQGYDFSSVTGDLHQFIQALGLRRPVIAGHSWGGNVALEYAARYADIPRGICLVDGGTFELSANPGMTLARAKKELAPPDFTGVTLAQLKAQARSWELGHLLTPQLEQVLLAGFEVLPDNTVRARLGRANHVQVIQALWEQRPSGLYPQVKCPVLLMPARQGGDASPQTRSLVRQEELAQAARLLQSSKTIWLEDSIHDVPLQRPQLVATLIREHIRSGFFGQ